MREYEVTVNEDAPQIVEARTPALAARYAAMYGLSADVLGSNFKVVSASGKVHRYEGSAEVHVVWDIWPETPPAGATARLEIEKSKNTEK